MKQSQRETWAGKKQGEKKESQQREEGRRGHDQLVYRSLIGGEGTGCHRVDFISPPALEDWELCAHGPQVVSIFHLVGFSHL